MSTQTFNAAENPALANQLAQQVDSIVEQDKPEASIVPPSDNLVTLPGGYISDAGEVITEVEVRELNGRDEEAIAKSNSVGRVLTAILSRGTVRIGNEEATEEMLEQMFAGDRDAILLGIFKATFGQTTELTAFCSGCEDYKGIQIDVDEDIKVKKLSDPIEQRRFDVKGKKNVYTLVLPTGKVQKELLLHPEKTLAELTTVLLEGTVRAIDGQPAFGKNQIQAIGVADRRILADELNKRSFGPVFTEVEAQCPDCSGKVVAPINLGTLFRF